MRVNLDHPVIRYLVIGLFSVGASVVLFLIGGSLAEVSGNEDTFLGLSFKASGAVGGFLITFWMSLRALDRLQPPSEPINFTVYLTGRPQPFSPSDRPYTAVARVFNRRSGEQREFEVQPRWELNHLTIDFRNVQADDLISARVEDAASTAWEFDYFYPLQITKETASFVKSNDA
jgi:hypothetical protein